MGNSSSSVQQDITNNTINETTLKSLNKQVMNASTNVLVESAKNCSSIVNQSNSCDVSGATIGGDLNLNGVQTNQASVNFACVNEDSVKTEMASAMMQAVMSEVKAMNGTEAAAKLEAAAQASKTSGFLAPPTGSSDSSVNTNVTNNVTNKTAVSVENILENNLKSNFTSETVSECIGKTTQTNKISAAGAVVGKNANVSCVQTNSVEQVQECKQLSDAINKTINQTAQDLGLAIVTESKTSSETKAEAKAESSNVSRGLDDLASSLTGIFAFMGLGFLGPAGGIISCVCCCICCILIIVLVVGVGSSVSSENFDMPSFNTLSASDINMSKGFSNFMKGGRRLF